MQMLLVTFGIVLLMSFLGYLTQLLKRAADKRQMEQDRERDRERRAAAALANPNVASRNDLDRYIQAVEAQRQRAGLPTARPVPRAAPAPAVPTVQPARKPKPDGVPTAFPVAKTRGAPVEVPDDLPLATVVTPRGSVPVAAPLLRREQVATLTPSRSTKSGSPIGRQLSALLSSREATALAVVLHEVLGPPKCRQHKPPPPSGG